jgi:hypothetical protein
MRRVSGYHRPLGTARALKNSLTGVTVSVRTRLKADDAEGARAWPLFLGWSNGLCGNAGTAA